MRQRHVWLFVSSACSLFFTAGVTQDKPIAFLLFAISLVVSFTAWIMICWTALLFMVRQITAREHAPEKPDFDENSQDMFHEDFGDNDQ